MDNERNWRFRLELTEQLGKMMPLFTPNDIREYLAPMLSQLVQDCVSTKSVLKLKGAFGNFDTIT